MKLLIQIHNIISKFMFHNLIAKNFLIKNYSLTTMNFLLKKLKYLNNSKATIFV